MSYTLQKIDRKILELLQEDASLSAADIGQKIGLSQSPCWRRIKRMEDEGIIRKRVTLLDRTKLNLGVIVFAHVKLSAHGRKTLPEFEAEIAKLPEVLECYMLMGEVDYLLKVAVPDVTAYEEFFRKHLSQLPAVREINSNNVVSEVKSTTALPVYNYYDN